MRCWLVLLTGLVVAAFAAGVANAEVFRWTDAQGRLHFAQRLDQVPERYREQAAGAKPSNGNFQSYASDADSASISTSREIKIPFRREGSLMKVSATLNGHLDVPFYIDTGASGVSIPAGYARRLGIQVGPDTQQIHVRTANGVIAVPYVRLDSVKLGGAQVEGLMATLNPTMSVGLLGGSFFNNFNYQVDPAANVISLTRNYASQSGLDEDYWRRRFRDIRRPLADLEKYLENHEALRSGRRAQLEQKREELRERLNALNVEANRDNVPARWRR